MIYSVNGELIHKEASVAVVECGGVGYACRTTMRTLSRLPEAGEKVKLLTYMSVREDAVELFGFYDAGELNCFKMLISVSGVGPKAALSILSDMSPEQFALTVATGDSKSITKTKGIGPKIAQRIVLELKDKISKEEFRGSMEDIDYAPVLDNSNTGEAISALVVLGYSQSEAARAVAALDKTLNTSELIKQALKFMSAKK